MNIEALNVLACPDCKGMVESENDGAGLRCSWCHRTYPVTDGIPVMLLARAHAPAPTPADPRWPEPGSSTDVPVNLAYRLAKISDRGLLRGSWLDCGCADGGYTEAMATMGAERVVGVEPDVDRLLRAIHRPSRRGVYICATSESLPFRNDTFDGVLLNEVLEHVADEGQTLREIYRVLRPGGCLALMSPNRWFLFEGHGMKVMGQEVNVPVPLLPWLPRKLALPFMRARNYWPSELCNLVAAANFRIMSSTAVLPVFQVYPWLPAPVIRWYRRAMPVLERAAFSRLLAVSTFVLARK